MNWIELNLTYFFRRVLDWMRVRIHECSENQGYTYGNEKWNGCCGSNLRGHTGGAVWDCRYFLFFIRLKKIKANIFFTWNIREQFFNRRNESKRFSLGIDPVNYESRLRDSWVWKELHSVRNVKPAFHKYGVYGGMMYTGLFYVMGRGKEPW